VEENYVNRSKLMAILFGIFCLSARFLVASQSLLSVDATMQPSAPARSRGPFRGSSSAGHSAGLPIRLDLVVPNVEVRPDGSVLVDFAITNVGTEPISLASSVQQNIEHRTSVLTLWLTSDAIMDQSARDEQTGRLFSIDAVGTSAELYGASGDPQSFVVLAPNNSILVHASSRVQLNSVTKTLSKPKTSPR
jgi:hypothetical protein